MKNILKIFFLFCTAIAVAAGLFYSDKKIEQFKIEQKYEGYIEDLFSPLDRDIEDYSSELKGLMEEFKTIVREGSEDIEAAKTGYTLSRQLAIVSEVRKEYKKKIEDVKEANKNKLKSSDFKKKFLREKVEKDWANYVYLKKPICIKLLQRLKENATDTKK